MKRILLAGVAVAALAGSAVAQSVPVSTVPNVATTIMIAPEQRAKIVQFVIRQKMKPVELSKQIAIGEILSSDVELLVFPGDWGPALSQYRFVYWQDGIAVVEPSSHRVVQIID
jgi:hypothetical protein